MQDAIAYMAWERVVPWKILSMTAHPGQPLAPLGFGARNRAFHERLGPGSRIWVVTRIAGAFSLAGLVTVREILDRERLPPEQWPQDAAGLFVKWRFVARADPAGSAFYEANNAGPVLAELRVRFAQNRTISYHDARLHDSFRACIDQARETVFLSYRWEEGRRFAFALAREFRGQGLSPWLDALSIPKYEQRGDPGVNRRRLEKLIQLGIEKSKIAIVVNTATFAKTPWTKMELDHIRKAGIPWFQVMRGGAQLEGDQPPIFRRKAAAVAQEILGRRAIH